MGRKDISKIFIYYFRFIKAIVPESIITSCAHVEHIEIQFPNMGHYENLNFPYLENYGRYLKLLPIILVLFWAIIPESVIKSVDHGNNNTPINISKKIDDVIWLYV